MFQTELVPLTCMYCMPVFQTELSGGSADLYTYVSDGVTCGSADLYARVSDRAGSVGLYARVSDRVTCSSDDLCAFQTELPVILLTCIPVFQAELPAVQMTCGCIPVFQAELSAFLLAAVYAG